MAAGGAALYWLVAVNPGPEMELEYIEGILGRESPVFYRDGTEKIGVLFQDAHRQYLPYHLIPKEFVNAIVAAEDDNFFKHHGFDFSGIARAMIANIKARRIIQGGSTISQQTAKNLFKRESRTFRAKFKELLYALRLEYHYPKEKILEFYMNQFFVSGNGHGLGVAARYYFDKNVNELTLLENAFIAGSVKRPNYYNPFTKANEELAARARLRAEQRAAYVLGKMHRLGYITDSEYKRAVSSTIMFDRGRMSFALNTIMDLVRDGLGSPEISEILDENGISNVSTSGVRIITTVDKELQENTFYHLRRELSRLDVRLRGYFREEVQAEYEELEYPGDHMVQPGAFMFGTIRKIERDPENNPLIRVSLGKNQEEGIVGRQGMERMLGAFVRFRKQRWSSVEKSDMPELLEQLQEGDKVYVSIQEIDRNGIPVLDLERYSDLQGGAMILQEGAIRAMAGGMENRYFNRAIEARRLMGSTFKPFVFAAALQLGWNSIDKLDNRRNIFVFQDRPYFPRPDHISPHNEVSLSWAGVTSENLAAVWLLYHLTDQLTPPRLSELAGYLDLAPREKNGKVENHANFRQRIRDGYGIVVNRGILQQAAYDRAVQALEVDFLFEDRAQEYQQLEQLPYGMNFKKYAEEIRIQLNEQNLPRGEIEELRLRLDILGRNYLGLRKTMEFFQQHQTFLGKKKTVSRLFDALAFLDKESGVLQPEGKFYRDSRERIIFSINEPQEGWLLLSEEDMKSGISGLDEFQLQQFWGQVQLEGYLSVYAYQLVTSQMEKEKQDLFSADPYSMEVLSAVSDYRVMVGLQYLIRLGREVGIAANLEPVLSFPLGSNVVSLLDSLRLYESLVTGKKYFVVSETEEVGELSTNGLAIIDRIEAVDGRTIYARQPESRNIFETKVSSAVGNILQNTVRHGTGKYAYNTVRLTSSDPLKQKLLDRLNLPLPLLGKTGTANQFRNTAFLGYVPFIAANDAEAQIPNGYTVGVYVGFDDNRRMVRTSTHITGSSGALPAWTAIASSIANLGYPADDIDAADLSFNGLPLRYPDTGQVFVPVDPGRGGQIIQGRGGLQTALAPAVPSILTHGRVGERGHFEPERLFLPFWKTAP
ncbi:MAG: transglycosylase domain-containing protein [Desulfobulbaceae bacterium]|nr:transglycosylase domain-containing protein [Desulfobulbaceae bacterium]